MHTVNPAMDNSPKWVLFNSKRSDRERYTLEEKWGIFIENESSGKYSHTNSYNFAMTLISQDDHLTAVAWATLE